MIGLPERRGLHVNDASRIKKYEGADFDTFARGRIGRRRRIFEGRMSGEAGAAVLNRIEALQQQGFVGSHRGEIIPSMVRAEVEQINFVLDASDGRDEILRAHTPRVTHRQWSI